MVIIRKEWILIALSTISTPLLRICVCNNHGDTSLFDRDERGFILKQMRFDLKQDKGVAGLTVLLSLIVMLFVIGLLVMIFALMGGELQGATTDATAIGVINDTTTSISSVTDWYDIFIVIGAMVVLILLTVIIIVAIRGSGLMAGGGSA